MFIITPTIAHVSSIKLILKLLRHVSVLIYHLQGAYKLCQLKFIPLAGITCKLPEDSTLTPKHVRVILILILCYLHVQLLVQQ